MEDCKMCMVPQIQLDVNHMMSATLGDTSWLEKDLTERTGRTIVVTVTIVVDEPDVRGAIWI